MRSVRLSVAASLDGFIADEHGGYDWIVHEPAIDFNAFYKTIDTVLMGRKTFELALTQGDGTMPGMKTIVFSRTLAPASHPRVEIVREHAADRVKALRREKGKDIWLMGGGELFGSLLEAGLVDTVEVGVIPVLLGAGIPLLPGSTRPVGLELFKHELFASGIAMLKYRVRQP